MDFLHGGLTQLGCGNVYKAEQKETGLPEWLFVRPVGPSLLTTGHIVWEESTFGIWNTSSQQSIDGG